MTIYAKAPFKHVTEFNNSTIAELFATPEFTAAVNAIAGGGGLEGTNYLYVAANGTDVENAAELQAAYTTAQGMSSSPNNRIIIIAAPGYYNFGSTPFIMNYDWIDLVSLDGNRSIIFNSSNSNGTIILDLVSDVYVKGVDVKTKAFGVETYYPGVIVENCKGGDNSFSSTFFNMGSKFIDCEGGSFSFGGNTVNATGTFTRCKAGVNSFGVIASGTFIDCVAGANSFGISSTGSFTNCTAGAYSFGSNPSFGSGIASGTFTRCTAGSYSFGYGITTTSGTFTDCVAGEDSFGFSSSVTGIFRRCRGGNQNFASYATLSSGTFIDCQASTSSFAVSNDTTGTYYGCIGGGLSFGAGGGFNGRAQYCVAGSASFGGNGGAGLRGVLYWCRLTSGTFVTVSGSGKTRYCVDGNDAQNNQG